VRLPAWGRLWAWAQAHRAELAALTLVTLVAAGLRLWGLERMPYTLSGDEGSIGQEIRRVLLGEIRNPFTLGWGPAPTMSFFMQAGPPWLFGLSPWTLRLTNALASIVAIPVTYLLARLLFNPRVALAAAILLAGYQMHLHYSRVAINVVYDSLFYPASLAALILGLRRWPHPAPFVLAGACAGMAQFVYTGARLLPIVMGAFLLYLLVFERSWLKGHSTNLILMLVAFLVVSGPMLAFAFQNPENYNARFNQVGIFQSGWVETEQATRGVGVVQVLFEQLRQALFGFGIYPDRTVSYGGGTLANPPMAVLLFLAIGLCLLSWWRRPAAALLMLWFWGVLIGGGVLTISPPSSTRLMGLVAALVILAALVLAESVWLLARALGAAERRRLVLALVAVLAIPVALLDVRYYFNDYVNSHTFGGTHAYIATQLGYELGDQSPPPHLYFFGAPRMWSGFSTLVFLAPEVERTDITEPLSTPQDVEHLVETEPPTSEAIFVFLEHRRAELDVVKQRYPGGTEQQVTSPTGEGLLFVVYRVPQSALATHPPFPSARNQTATVPETPVH
jgi:4-amino-4-deoxy-L-arabinose transferase-like glycosyltransferase